MLKKRRVLLSWSSGKDSAWTLYQLQQQPDVELLGLVTTFNESADRVAMHAVRRELAEAQAEAANLPLWPVMLPWPCSNDEYEARMRDCLREAKSQGITHMAFGDLYLEDVRDYRIQLLEGSGIEPIFPIWADEAATSGLAKSMISSGLRAVITCVDPKQIPERFCGCQFDAELLAELPLGVDHCGENGEFHSFCYEGPMFEQPILVTIGERVDRDGFCFADVLPQ